MKPKKITFYMGGFLGSELKTASIENPDFDSHTKEFKRLRNLCFPDRNGINPGLYTCVERGAYYSKFNLI